MFRKMLWIAVLAACLAATLLIAMSFTNDAHHSRLRKYLYGAEPCCRICEDCPRTHAPLQPRICA